MSDIELDIKDQNTLEFEVEIGGADPSNVQVRMVIESNAMNLTFNGRVNESTVSFDIPSLNNVLKPDTYKYNLEFIVEGDKFFAPMEGELDLIRPVSIKAQVKESVKKTTPKKSSDKPTFSINKPKTMDSKIAGKLSLLSQCSSINEMVAIYAREVLENKTAEVDTKVMLEAINNVVLKKHNKTFKEYLKEVK